MIDVDINGLFDEYQIPFREKGENVTVGWINLEVCPFCMNSNYHCGVNLKSGGFHCWVCGEKGGLWKLLKEMEQFHKLNIGYIINKFKLGQAFTRPIDYNATTEQSERKKKVLYTWPEGALKELPQPHRNYLISRGFDPDFLIKKYKIRGVYNVGKHKWRIIIPTILNGKMVSWVAAWVFREKYPNITPYFNIPPKLAVVPINHCLYNLDTVTDTVIIVEGIIDVWRCGDGFVCSFRKGMTAEQISLLVQKAPKRVFIMYDAEAIRDANNLADNLAGLFPHVEVLELASGDPGELTKQQVQDIRRDIFKNF